MRILCLLGTVAWLLTALNANCQQATLPLNQRPLEKTLLFSHLPEKFSCPVNALQNIFSASVNDDLSVALGPQLQIEGTVLAKVAVTPDQLSINIRCSNFQNALLNISRITKTDGSFSYTGRVVSLQHGDVLLLWEENGQYTFTRQKQLLSMVE